MENKKCEHSIMEFSHSYEGDDINIEFFVCEECKNHFQKDVWQLVSSKDISRAEFDEE